MKTLLFVALGLMLSVTVLPAQDNYYWIKFKDKNNSGYTINNPYQFLSAASIQRRTTQKLTVNETDLPVSQAYIDSIAPYITELKHRLKWFNLIVVQLTNPASENLIKSLPFVAETGKIEVPPSRGTEEDTKFEAVVEGAEVSSGSGDYGIAYNQAAMLKTDTLHSLGYRGKNVLVAVMDNGFSNVDSIAGFDSVRARILATWDFVHNDADVYDDGSHGTNVFSCMAGNMPGNYLGTGPDASYFLLESEEGGREWVMEEYNWAAAAEWADSAGANIFSTSLGYTRFDNGVGDHTYADLDGHKTIITRAGNMAFSKGILVVNSAGNEGAGAWNYISPPSDGDSVMAVGAVNALGEIAGFSGRGPRADGRIKPDVCAQGVQSGVITVGGDLGTSGGTSFSCPILAGSAASLWGAFPDKTVRDIYTAIIVSCPTFWSPDNDYGYGIPNFYTAYKLLEAGYGENVVEITDKLILYPNPFASELQVIFFSEAKDNTHIIEVFDISGRKVFYKEVGTENPVQVLGGSEVGNLAAGKYILRLDGNRKNSHIIIKSN